MPTVFKIVAVALFSAFLVLMLLAFQLSRGLPEDQATSLAIPAAGLKFAFGAGNPEEHVVMVNEFADGYALLSSGPIDIKADELQTLQYTWLPSMKTGELAFFWRQKGNTAEVKRAEILAKGTAFLDLSTQPDWSGEIIEIGVLVAGDSENSVAIGELVLMPTDFSMRAKLVWQDWSTYELRSQQSINFLQGGAHNQTAPLPILVIAWLLVTLLLVRILATKIGFRTAHMLPLAIYLFLAAWMLLDIRWTINSIQNATELLSGSTESNADQRAGNDLDGEVFKYIQRLKNDIIQADNSGRPERILIIGDENAIDYYLLRSKYHLLPSSAHVAGRFDTSLLPESLDYVIYFGQPANITNTPGWTSAWRNALKEVDRNEWGAVYRVQP